MAFFKKLTYRKLSDQDLIILYKERKDKNIIGELYERYGHLVLGSCLKYLKNMDLAEDITMTIFEKLFDKLLTHEVNYFKGWIHTLTRNECLMLLRKKRIPESEINNDLLQSEETDSNNEQLQMDIKKLKSALKELKSDQEACVRLFYIEGYCYQEIAEELKMDFKKVKSNIQNGKRNLKIALSNG